MIRAALLFSFALLSLPAAAQPAEPSQAAAATNADSLVRIGDRMRATGDIPGALGFYQRALEVDPKNISALRAAGQLLADTGAAAASEQYFQQLLAITPSDPVALLGRARALNARLRPEEALRQLDALKGADATSAAALSERGLALDLSGDPQAAQMVYGDALTAAGASGGDIRIRLALSFALSKDYRTANQLLQQMVNVPGLSDRVRGALGLAYALAGDAAAGAQIATLGKPPEEAKALLPFYSRLASLPARQQAAAVHLGVLETAGPPTAVVLPAPAAAAPPPQAAAEQSGTWVQLGAFASAAQLKTAWGIIERNAADLISRRPVGTSRIAGFDRLLIGPLAAGDAATLASQFKSRGIDAFVRSESLTLVPLN